MHSVHTENYKGYTIEISQDQYAGNPYEEWDNLGTMCHWHRRGFIGEDLSRLERETIQSRVDKILAEGGVLLPVYLYEHSGQTINTKGFSCPWDSGQVGFIYCDADKIRKEYSCKRITKKTREKVTEALRAQVKTLDDYLTGNVYGYIVKDAKGEEQDSCWGFYGDYDQEHGILSEAKSAVDSLEKEALPLLAQANPLHA